MSLPLQSKQTISDFTEVWPLLGTNSVIALYGIWRKASNSGLDKTTTHSLQTPKKKAGVVCGISSHVSH